LRNTTDVLRRGFDSTLANWPLIAIRIAESVLFVMIVVASIFAAIVPVGIAASFSTFRNADEPSEAIAAFVTEHWPLIVYIFLVVLIVTIVLIAIHSFVEAGSARVFVDAERNATGDAPKRDAFRAFNMDRWMQGGRASWWTVFWIYNIVWGIGGLIFLVPLILTLAAMFMVTEAGGRLAIACSGLALTFLVVIPVSMVMALVSEKAITIAVARAASAGDAVRAGWSEIKRDFGRHFAVAFIVFAIALGGAMAISSLMTPMSIVRDVAHAPLTSIAFAPAQIVSSFAQSVFSAAVGLWFLAAYVGLTEEK